MNTLYNTHAHSCYMYYFISMPPPVPQPNKYTPEPPTIPQSKTCTPEPIPVLPPGTAPFSLPPSGDKKIGVVADGPMKVSGAQRSVIQSSTCKGISVETAQRYLHRVGFDRNSHAASEFFDGHDRKDVVLDRDTFSWVTSPKINEKIIGTCLL